MTRELGKEKLFFLFKKNYHKKFSVRCKQILHRLPTVIWSGWSAMIPVQSFHSIAYRSEHECGLEHTTRLIRPSSNSALLHCPTTSNAIVKCSRSLDWQAIQSKIVILSNEIDEFNLIPSIWRLSSTRWLTRLSTDFHLFRLANYNWF